MTLRIALFSACLLAIVTAARSASATAYYIQGASCKSHDSMVQFNNLGAVNKDTVAATVNCPLTLLTQPSTLQWAMVAYDRDPSTNVVCTLTPTDPSGTIPGTVSPSVLTTTGSGTSSQTISTSGFVSSGTSNAYWLLSCSIPPMSSGQPSIFTAAYIAY